jgi:dihydroorotate dehydrogenase electron transfer subunit
MQIFAEIIENKEIAKDIYNMIVLSKEIASVALPGQFAHIRVRDSIDPLLRRPISICDVDKHNDTVRLIYRKQGHGTTILSKLKPLDTVDMLAPLGKGTFPCENNYNDVYLIGGGIGAPPLLYAAKILTNKGSQITTVLGFASKEQAILEAEFQQYGNTIVYTIDGTHGKKGLVTDYFNNIKPNIILACGPISMLKAIKYHPNLSRTNGFLSLEEHMACGIGACMGCVTKVSKQSLDIQVSSTEWKYEKVCDCGPVFPMEKVVL